jgi:hypothetical protein
MTISVFPGSIPELGILLDTPEWSEWLSCTNQFKYVGNLTEMSVKRRISNGKWYARKKVYSSDGGSKPIDLYIGNDSECTAEKLQEINAHFAKDWISFWQWYHSPSRKQGKGKGVQDKKLYTEELSSSQTQEEITQLRTENERLKQREQYLLDQLGLVKTQIIHEAQERVKQLEARVNELDNANWQCEKNLTIVSELHRKSELKRQELQSLVDKYQTPPDQSLAIALQPTTNDQKLLTQAELAKRLGCDPGTLVKNRNKPNFQEWSRGKDPEGKAWKYLPDTQRYGLV